MNDTESHLPACPECDGKGGQTFLLTHADTEVREDHWVDCEACAGTGRQSREQVRTPCRCEWTQGDQFTPPEPIVVCEYCEGAMAASHRIAHAINRHVATLTTPTEKAVAKDILAAFGGNPYA